MTPYNQFCHLYSVKGGSILEMMALINPSQRIVMVKYRLVLLLCRHIQLQCILIVFFLITARNSSCGKVCFNRRVSFLLSGEGEYPSMQWAGECVSQQTPPLVNTPWADFPPPHPRRPLKRAVSVLLECVLVYLLILIYFNIYISGANHSTSKTVC